MTDKQPAMAVESSPDREGLGRVGLAHEGREEIDGAFDLLGASRVRQHAHEFQPLGEIAVEQEVEGTELASPEPGTPTLVFEDNVFKQAVDESLPVEFDLAIAECFAVNFHGNTFTVDDSSPTTVAEAGGASSAPGGGPSA